MALKEKHLAEGEHIVLDLRTHWKALIPALSLLVGIVVLVLLAWWWSSDSDYATWVGIVAGVVAAVLFLTGVALPVLRWNTERYVVTNRRVSHRSGILNQVGRDIPLHRVNDVGLEKGLLDRALGCGTLIVSDATEKAGMRMHDVPDVERVQVELQNLLQTGGDPGRPPPR